MKAFCLSACDRQINDRAVPVEVEIHKAAILSLINQSTQQSQSVYSSMATPTIDHKSAFGKVDVDFDADCTHLLSPSSHPPPPPCDRSTLPCSSAAGEST